MAAHQQLLTSTLSEPEFVVCCIAGLKELRSKMNTRARDLILGWLKEKGLAPDAQSDLGKQGLGHKKHRRSLLSPLWLLAHAFHQQQQEQGLLSAGDS
jgi:hypothetical protein